MFVFIIVFIIFVIFTLEKIEEREDEIDTTAIVYNCSPLMRRANCMSLIMIV